ncbi:CinA family protein [Solimonas flava]|uniref:CinA family protein n=1 Tax=Solimonas flava TaxID=415849 RepID=UPI000488F90E|nr:CinA family protein [Solimonas flava]
MSDRLVERIAAALLARGEWLATAESCTGGLIAKLLTDLPGSSGWFERGLVTYSNLAKMELLGVPDAVLAEHGAVSDECARAMARGVLRAAPVDWGIAVTGIAGPGGGSDDKPVGTVWIAWSRRGHAPDAHRFFFEGGRDSVREQTAQAALEGLLYRIREAA